MIIVSWNPTDSNRSAITFHPDGTPVEELSVQNGMGISEICRKHGIDAATYKQAFPEAFRITGWQEGDPQPANWDVPITYLGLPGRPEDMRKLAAMLGEPLEVRVFERGHGYRHETRRHEMAA